jgi:hypothetical protein
MTAHINVSVNNGREVNKALNLAALFPTAAVSVRHIHCVTHFAVMMLRDSISAQPDKQQSSGGGVPICYAKLTAHKLREIQTICAIVTGFVVSRHYAQYLIGDWSK